MGILSSIPSSKVDESDFLFGLRFCNGELCQRWRFDNDVLISLMPIPTSHEEKKVHGDDSIIFWSTLGL